MFRPILFIVLGIILYRLIKGSFKKEQHTVSGTEPDGMISEMIQDTFCGTYVPREEAYRKVIRGNEMFFCSRECAEKFEQEAENKTKRNRS